MRKGSFGGSMGFLVAMVGLALLTVPLRTVAAGSAEEPPPLLSQAQEETEWTWTATWGPIYDFEIWGLGAGFDDSVIAWSRDKIFKITKHGTISNFADMPYSRFYPFMYYKLISDGGFLAIGAERSLVVPQDEQPWLIKIDSNFNVEWENTYGLPGPYYSRNKVSATEVEGGKYVAIAEQTFGASGSSLLFLRINHDGTLEEAITFQQSELTEAYCKIFNSLDGGFLIYWAPTLFKMDSVGEIQWAVSWKLNTMNFSIIQSSDRRHLYFAGDAAIASTSELADYEGWVAKFDECGALEWEKRYRFDEVTSFRVNQILPAENNGFYLIQGHSTFFKNSSIIKFDSEGQPLWNRIYLQDGPDGIISIRNAAKLSSGAVALAGSRYLNDRLTKHQIFRLDQNGEIGESCVETTTYTVSSTAAQRQSTPASVTLSSNWPYKVSPYGRPILAPEPATEPDLCIGSGTFAAVASASSVSGPLPLSVNFTGKAILGSPPYSYDWDFGDGSPHSADQNPSHTYNSEGTFRVTLKVTDSGGSAASDDHLSIAARPCDLECAATVPGTASAGSPIQFGGTATSQICPGTPAFAWVFGDGGTSAEQSPSHTYAAEGTYDWSLTVTHGGLSCTKTGSVVVSPPCIFTCTATVPLAGAVGKPVVFSATADPSNCAGKVEYSWKFGDGQTSTEQNPRHAYSAAGSFSWKLTVTVAATTCEKSGTIKITTDPCSISLSITVPLEGRAGVSVACQANVVATNCSGEASYTWNFGDGESSVEKAPNHVYDFPGNYNWSVVAALEGATCSKSGLIVIGGDPPDITTLESGVPIEASVAIDKWIYFKLHALVGAEKLKVETTDSTADVDLYVKFGEKPGLDSWDYRPATSSGNELVEITPQSQPRPLAGGDWFFGVRGYESASFTITATVTGGTPCSLTCEGQVPAAGEAGSPVAFRASANGSSCASAPTYRWDFGDGEWSFDQNPSHTYGAGGSYRWTLLTHSDDRDCGKSGELAVAKAVIRLASGVAAEGTIAAGDWEHYKISVPQGATELFVGTTSSITALDLYVRFGAKPDAENWDYKPPAPGGDKSVKITAESEPKALQAGEWYIAVQSPEAGLYTIIATVAGGKPGDCDGDGSVGIGEVQKAINMFLGTLPPACSVDCNAGGSVSISELQKVINNFLGASASC